MKVLVKSMYKLQDLAKQDHMKLQPVKNIINWET